MTTIAELQAAYTAGATNQAAVAERFLAADPTAAPETGAIGAFRAVDGEDVRAQAARSTARLAGDGPRLRLEGVPLAIKDVVAVDGYPTLLGTRDLAHHGSGDAEVVRRLRAAGALIAGKAHTTELGLSPTGVNLACGTPRNPHAADHLPGGSSSGTGAAVAAGQVLGGLGSDGGGSIRIPAAACGVFGIKPSWQRVPTDGGAHVGWWSLDHLGPIARCADDLRLLLEVMADIALPAPPGPLRWGVDWTWWGRPDAAVDAACRAVVAEVDAAEVALPHVDLAGVSGYVTALTELAAGVHDVLRDRPDALSDDVRAAVAQAPTISGADYVRAQQVRTALAASFADVFAAVDVVLAPTTATPAPPRPTDAELAAGVLDIDQIDAMTAYTFPANLCGLPAASVPVGCTADGLPIGLQVIGPRDGDAIVLAACTALEDAGLAVRPRPAKAHVTH